MALTGQMTPQTVSMHSREPVGHRDQTSIICAENSYFTEATNFGNMIEGPHRSLAYIPCLVIASVSDRNVREIIMLAIQLMHVVVDEPVLRAHSG